MQDDDAVVIALEHVSQDIDKKVFGVFGKYNIE
jgi:hypothetical protein